MRTKIINRGRGPEIEGTRITVYDVLDYAKHGWHRDRTAALFRLSSRDIQAAPDYIQQHKEEVAANYKHILERQKHHTYPPDIEAKIHASRERAKARIAAMKSLPENRTRDDQDHG
ncbi:DUF433 domain-containing protein [Candidatus Entotheonella palauensis]|uniref:DUF433 domain-containing protein n=1 Tax=Candidatus Entotheonella gemina TaxID=1429439 RepID=W4MAX9_9BACT|nr:DUF433 domain-containing protein [Candidatus Entotheonella palauensis]ETX07320.1 MAG: hypothetical protein ETSY2_11875 [Candidatus Entotheonella gemina]